MSQSIYDYPVEQRPRLAVARFRRIQGDYVFDLLLEHLNLDYESFVNKYGEKLVGNPTCLNQVIVDMMVGIFRKTRRNMKCSDY